MKPETSNIPKSRRPVFIVGSARSGNTLLYHTLLSAGGFPIYLAEPAVFDLLAPKFGNLSLLRNRRKLMKVWLRSHMYAASGLNSDHITNKIVSECKGSGDFLRILMNEIARSQDANRWAVWGPDNLLYMEMIKKEIPDALFIHMIRDGRDVAVSMNKEGWIRPFPWDKSRRLLVAALHWHWKVRRGRELGRQIPPDYLEVRFENLVTEYRQTLLVVSEFIGQDLEYKRIQNAGFGVLREPNSSFKSGRGSEYGPVGRWKNVLSAEEIADLESLIGPLLNSLGYQLAASKPFPPTLEQRIMTLLYPSYFDAKQWFKLHTPLRKLVRIGRLRLKAELPQRAQ